MRRSQFGEVGRGVYCAAAVFLRCGSGCSRVCARAGGEPIGMAALNALRLEAGVPWFPADFNDGMIPHEAVLENTHISFNKGCYTGTGNRRAGADARARQPEARAAEIFDGSASAPGHEAARRRRRDRIRDQRRIFAKREASHRDGLRAARALRAGEHRGIRWRYGGGQGRRLAVETPHPEILKCAPDAAPPLLVLCLRSLCSRRLLCLPLAREVRHHSYHALQQHQLAAVMHFVLFRASSMSKRVLDAGEPPGGMIKTSARNESGNASTNEAKRSPSVLRTAMISALVRTLASSAPILCIQRRENSISSYR